MDKVIKKINLYVIYFLIVYVPVMGIVSTFFRALIGDVSFLGFNSVLQLCIPIQLLLYIYNLLKKNTKITKYDIIIYLLIIIGIIVTLNAYDVKTAIWGAYLRNEGLVAFISYYLIFLNCKSLKEDEIKSIISLLFIVGIAQLIYSILQVFVRWECLDMFSTNNIYFMAGGFIGNPNMLGSYCIMLLGLAFMSYIVYNNKKYLILSILFYINLILAQSTGPFFAFIILFVFAVIFMKIKKVINWKKIGMLFSIFVVTFFVVSNGVELYVTNVFGDTIARGYTIKGDIINTVALFTNMIKDDEETVIPEEKVEEVAIADIPVDNVSEESEVVQEEVVNYESKEEDWKEKPITETPLEEVGLDNYGSGRFKIWKNTLKLVPKYFWFGAGYDNFGYVYQDHEVAIYYNEKTGEKREGVLYYDKAHNDYLQLLLTGGIFNFVIYISLLLILFIDGVRSKNKLAWVLLAAFIGYALQAFLGISVVAVAPIFYMIMGMLAGLVEKKVEKV